MEEASTSTVEWLENEDPVSTNKKQQPDPRAGSSLGSAMTWVLPSVAEMVEVKRKHWKNRCVGYVHI